MVNTQTSSIPRLVGSCSSSVIAEAEFMLASLPGSRLTGCTVDVTECCGYFCDDSSDRVRLRFGSTPNLPGECLHLEVADQYDEVFYSVPLTDPVMPDALCNRLIQPISALLAIAINNHR